MFCPKCGKINPDSEKVCSGCGAELREEVASPVKKKKGSKLWLVIVALLIIAVVAVLLLSGCSTGEIPKEQMSF